MELNDFYYICSKDGKVKSNSIGTWLNGLGFNPTSAHIDYYLKLIKKYSKNTEMDNISLDEFYYFLSLEHNKEFYNI